MNKPGPKARLIRSIHRTYRLEEWNWSFNVIKPITTKATTAGRKKIYICVPQTRKSPMDQTEFQARLGTPPFNQELLRGTGGDPATNRSRSSHKSRAHQNQRRRLGSSGRRRIVRSRADHILRLSVEERPVRR